MSKYADEFALFGHFQKQTESKRKLQSSYRRGNVGVEKMLYVL